jgi:hypothetical protein
MENFMMKQKYSSLSLLSLKLFQNLIKVSHRIPRSVTARLKQVTSASETFSGFSATDLSLMYEYSFSATG